MSANTDNSYAAIIDQSNRRVLAGYPFTIDCGVLGENNMDPETSGVTVTWYKDGTSLSTGLSYTVDKPTAADSGDYYFVASNAYGSTTSDSVSIEIITPGEDQFGVNLIQNGYGEDGLSNWTPQIGNIRINKFWMKSGDKAMFGPWGRFPNPGRIDPKYSHRDGLVYFTAEDVEYQQKSKDYRMWIRPNEGGNLTTCYQDVFLTDPDTLDIIDRKIEGVFDVEVKCFGWLGQRRSTKVYFQDDNFWSGWRTSNGSRKDGEAVGFGYEETIREVHDESKLRYEFYDVNDELMKSFEMDSFRTTRRNSGMAVGYKSLSIPPGTRRIRAHMMFRRDTREHEWTSRRKTFAKQYMCGVHAVNVRLFINKDGLKFPSLKFDPNDLIDMDLTEQIEQQIMDSQIELRKAQDFIEDCGNIQIRNKITKTYSHPSQTGVLQWGLKYLADWTRNEISHYAHSKTYVGRKLPGLETSDWWQDDFVRIDSITGADHLKAYNVGQNAKHLDLRLKVMGQSYSAITSAIPMVGGKQAHWHYLDPNFRRGQLLAHQINYYIRGLDRR